MDMKPLMILLLLAAAVTTTTPAAAVTTTTPAAAVTTTTPAAAVTTTTPVVASTDPPSSSEGILKVQFSLDQTFNSDLSKPSSSEFTTLSANVVSDVNKVFAKTRGFRRSIVNSFRVIKHIRKCSPTHCHLSGCLASQFGSVNGTAAG
eukprot:XP_014037728.1 PREDICTED: cell wall protein DAN4-like [Salmo salar]